MAGEPVVFGLEVKGADAVARAYAQVTAEVTKAAEAENAASASAKSITAAATEQAEAVKEAGRQSAVTAQAARAVAPAAEAAAVGMKSAASAGQNLRFQLADVFTSLAGGMNPLMVLAQQGPQIAEAFGGAAKSADVLKAALGPAAGLGGVVLALAPAVLAAGGAFLYFKGQLEDAEKAAAKASTAATTAQTAFEKLRDSQRIDIVKAGIMAGEFDKSALTTSEAQFAAERKFGEMRLLAAAEVERVETEIAESRKSVQSAKVGVNNLSNSTAIAEGNTAIRKGNEELAKKKEALQAVEHEIANAAAATVDWAEWERKAAEDDKNNKKGRKDALKELSDAERELARRNAESDKARLAAGAAIVAQVEKLAPAIRNEEDQAKDAINETMRAVRQAAFLGEISQTDAARYVNQLELALSDIDMKAFQAALEKGFEDAGTEALPKLQAEFEKMAADAQRVLDQRTQRIGQGVGSALSGDLMGGLGAVMGKDPMTAAIMASVQGLGALGAQGADATAKQIEATAMGVVKGLKELGPLIGELIPMLAVEIPVALVKAIPQIVTGLRDGLLGAAADLGKRLWEAITFGDAIRQWWDGMGGWGGIKDALRDWWRDVWAAIRDFFTRTDEEKTQFRKKVGDTALEWVTLGIANTDTYNPGAYQSRNERMGPTYRPQAAMFAAPSPAGGGGLAGAAGGGGSVHIHMPPGLMIGTADEVVRKLSQHMGTGGRRLSLPPGSVRG